MKWLSLVAILFLVGCSSTSKKDSSLGDYTPSDYAAEEDSRIDLPALQTALGLNRAPETLGYTEKIFNTCEVGYGYPSNKDCKKETFIVLHFQLLCRDSEGTISEILTDDFLKPIAFKDLKWTLKGIDGTVKTDRKGFVQIRTTSLASQKRERLKVSLGEDFLYMRANEITKVITPKAWCQD